MSKRHDAIFEDVLKGLTKDAVQADEDRGATRSSEYIPVRSLVYLLYSFFIFFFC